MNYDNDIFIPKIWHVLYIYIYIGCYINLMIRYTTTLQSFPKTLPVFLIYVSFARNAMQFNVCNGYAHLRSIC